MKSNRSMRKLLLTLASPSPDVLVPSQAVLLEDDLLEEEGCWFLSSLRKGTMSAVLSQFPDRTGLECFVNHVHMGDLVHEEAGVSDLHRQGLAFAQQLFARLKIHGQFVVIASFDDLDCSVRFHRARPGERWLLDDLDSYEEESLLVLDD